MDYATIQTLVTFRLGSRDDLASGTGLTVLQQWIHSAYLEICHTFRFTNQEASDSSLVTSSTSRYVTIPDNVFSIISVSDTTNKTPLDPFEGDFPEYERQTIGGSTGKPTKWLRFANRIYLKDPPAGAYNLRCGFWMEPTAMVNPTDTPDLPAVWHEGIVILATRNGWRGIDDGGQKAVLIETGEWPAFLSRVRKPKSVEQYNAKRRGLKVRRGIVDPSKGV